MNRKRILFISGMFACLLAICTIFILPKTKVEGVVTEFVIDSVGGHWVMIVDDKGNKYRATPPSEVWGGKRCIIGRKFLFANWEVIEYLPSESETP